MCKDASVTKFASFAGLYAAPCNVERVFTPFYSAISAHALFYHAAAVAVNLFERLDPDNSRHAKRPYDRRLPRYGKRERRREKAERPAERCKLRVVGITQVRAIFERRAHALFVARREEQMSRKEWECGAWDTRAGASIGLRSCVFLPAYRAY